MESGEKCTRAHSDLEKSTRALGAKLQDKALGTPESEDQSFDPGKKPISLQTQVEIKAELFRYKGINDGQN